MSEVCKGTLLALNPVILAQFGFWNSRQCVMFSHFVQKTVDILKEKTYVFSQIVSSPVSKRYF